MNTHIPNTADCHNRGLRSSSALASPFGSSQQPWSPAELVSLGALAHLPASMGQLMADGTPACEPRWCRRHAEAFPPCDTRCMAHVFLPATPSLPLPSPRCPWVTNIIISIIKRVTTIISGMIGIGSSGIVLRSQDSQDLPACLEAQPKIQNPKPTTLNPFKTLNPSLNPTPFRSLPNHADP